MLEVFEGISARELLQKELSVENRRMLTELTEEFKAVRNMFDSFGHNPPAHPNMTPTVGKLLWVSLHFLFQLET